MADFELEIKDLIRKQVTISDIVLEVPKNASLGDYAFPCYLLAKEQKKNPIQIALDLATKIKPIGSITKIEAAGPYLNFFVDKSAVVAKVIDEILKEKNHFGSTHIGKNKHALIEHTSVNPNASPHLGRARNAMIGDSLARMLRFHGFKTEVHYFVNDIGKQIAMLVIGCENKKDVTFDDLLSIYMDISKQTEENLEIEKQIFELLHKLEEGDEKTKTKFEHVVKICIDGQKRILHEFGIDYDFFDHESKYLFSKKTNDILAKFEKMGKLFVDEQNRKVLDLKGFDIPIDNPIFVLTRADGTSLYQLRDITYHIEKIEKAENNYLVLGEDHKLYFSQLTAALKLLGYDAPKVIHYSFVLLNEGKMSTRKGNVVLLEGFMNEAKEKALSEIKKRHGDVPEAEKLAKMIGYGAVKFAILKVSAEKNVMFDWEAALNFEGESGPYIQYSHARIASLITKFEDKFSQIPKEANLSLLRQEPEIKLAVKLADFENVAKKAFEDLRPHIIANYANELAQKFNEFYHDCQVIVEEDEELSKARVLLSIATKQVLRNSLELLGIDAPERM